MVVQPDLSSDARIEERREHLKMLAAEPANHNSAVTEVRRVLGGDDG